MRPRARVPTLDEVRELLTPALRQSQAKRAIVFGSYARGEADEHSDLDLIIVADTSKRFVRRGDDFPGIIQVWRRGLDLLVYTPEELSRMADEGNPFIEKALAEGVVIYEES